jgi:hypothetical protein
VSASTVLGNGPVALAHALFAARHGPVVLAGRAVAPCPGVESVPAAVLTLLLELGITPAELDIDRLGRSRLVAWEQAEPQSRGSPACAQLNRAALVTALWRRIRGCPQIHVVGRLPAGPEDAVTGRLVDATGRRAVTAHDHIRPGQPWVAASCTVLRRTVDPTMRLAAGPGGYAYRLGSASWLTIGWAGTGVPPRDADALHRRIVDAGAGWLIEQMPWEGMPTTCRVASVSIPVRGPGPFVALGDAALARDALASQGSSIGLSDARLAAEPATSTPDITQRATEGRDRHLRFLTGVLGSCRHRDAPAWSQYRQWVTHQRVRLSNSATVPAADVRISAPSAHIFTRSS